MKRLIFIIIILLTFNGCMDIFTTSAFSSFATDPSDMNDEELIAYLSSTPLSEISEENLAIAETALLENRIELTDSDLSNTVLVKQYIEETIQLLEINMAQANVDSLITDVLSIDGEDGDSDIMTTILDNTERLDNIEEASEYAVDAYRVDPDSLTSTELVVGGVGLISDIIQDEAKADALDTAADVETKTLEDAGFTADEIENIQTASAMLNLAESGVGEDSPMSALFEGLPI